MNVPAAASVPHADLTAQLGVRIDPELLVLALTHRSFAYENPGTGHNERLEFLGDSILGQAVTVMLYQRFPELDEGDLAKRRASLVSTVALAEVARRLDLGRHIRLGRGEELTGGEDKSSILADTVEAVIGACYLDVGGEAATTLVLRLIEPFMDDPDRFGIAMDPKTALQEMTVSRGLGAPVYEVTGTGPDHARVFTAQVFIDGEFAASGEGTSKKSAEMFAAMAAVEALQMTSGGGVA